MILMIITSGRYSGSGENLIISVMNGETVYICDFALKFILTILTMSLGFHGGEITPLFSIGASLGFELASLFGLPSTVVAELGFSAVFCGGTNTLIASMLLGVEKFGYEYFPLFFYRMCNEFFSKSKSIYLFTSKINRLKKIQDFIVPESFLYF